MGRRLMRWMGAAAAALIGGCAHSEPDAVMLRKGAAVTPVLTEHTAGLKCLGGLIDQSGAAPVSVSVKDIDDTTVPLLNEERRLSMGGAFVLQTALSRMETDKVQGVLEERAAGARRLTLSGAWTQDDPFSSSAGLGVKAHVGEGAARFGARNAYDFIAGDFASSVNGRVLISTAVGVALARRGREALLIVDDGRDGAEVGLDRTSVQGAQMAQRRILEAVALVHLAHYFKIDYRPCLAASHAAPDAFIAALNAYAGMASGARTQAVQAELVRLGYVKTAPKTWDAGSAKALSTFQIRSNLPPTGRPSATLYALLVVTPKPR